MDKTLRRLDDDFRIHGQIQFVEFNKETKRGKKLHQSIFIGGAAMVDWEDGKGCIWQTSEIIEKISETEFKTKNSHYVIEDTDPELLKKLKTEVRLIRSSKYQREVSHAIVNPIMRDVRTEDQIQASVAKAVRVFKAIEKARK